MSVQIKCYALFNFYCRRDGEICKQRDCLALCREAECVVKRSKSIQRTTPIKLRDGRGIGNRAVGIHRAVVRHVRRLRQIAERAARDEIFTACAVNGVVKRTARNSNRCAAEGIDPAIERAVRNFDICTGVGIDRTEPAVKRAARDGQLSLVHAVIGKAYMDDSTRIICHFKRTAVDLHLIPVEHGMLLHIGKLTAVDRKHAPVVIFNGIQTARESSAVDRKHSFCLRGILRAVIPPVFKQAGIAALH